MLIYYYTRYKKTENAHDILIAYHSWRFFFRRDDLFFTQLLRTYLYIQNVLFIFYTQWKLYNDKIQKLNGMTRVKIFIDGSSLLHNIYIYILVRFYDMVFGLLLYLLCLACIMPCHKYMAYGAYNNIQCRLLRITENCPRSRARNTRIKSNHRVLSSCTYLQQICII